MDELHIWEMGKIYALNALRTPFLDKFFLFLDFFDRQEFLMVLIPAIWLGYRSKSGVRIFYITVLSGVVNYLLKRGIGEPRPCHLDPSIGLLFFLSYGFPSGAAQQAVLLSGILIRSFQNLWTWVVGLNYIFWVSFSRIYLGVHFPSDILGGWVVGLFLLAVYIKVFPRIEKKLKTFSFPFKLWLALLIPSLAPLIYFSPKMVAAAFLCYGVGIGMLLSQKLRLLAEDPENLFQGVRRACLAIAALFLIHAVTEPLFGTLPLYSYLFVQNFLFGLWLSFGIYLLLKQKRLIGLPLLFLTFSVNGITPEEAKEIGLKVWQNECGGKEEGLTSWNIGEDFASLGIGHFIWYPKGKRGPFTETFPELMHYLKGQGADVPNWLFAENPWSCREEFLQAFQSKKMQELRKLLFETVDTQALFIAARLEKLSAPKVQTQVQRILKEPMGLYALIDYLNFKGEGTSQKERYQGQGWGLVQVLEEMDTKGSALPAFVSSAKKVLERRVCNAPTARNEHRWLKGWHNRLETYLF